MKTLPATPDACRTSPGTPIRRVSGAARRALVASLAILACGCGSKSARLASDPRTSAVAPTDLAASPVVRASENGLEVAWWVVTSNQAAITAAMAPYLGRPVPLDDQTRALWEANGLRMVAVPVARLDELRQSMAIVGAIQRQWLGQTPMWTDTVTGPAWSGHRSLALDSGRLSLGAGRLRLLTRCWTVPVPVLPQESDPSPAAALHIELLPQHLEAADVRGGGGGLMPIGASEDTADPLADGLVFRRLLAEMTVSQGDAYVIIPQRSGADWTLPAADDASGPANRPQESREAEPTAAPPHVPGIGRVSRDVSDSPSAPAAQPDADAAFSHGPPEVPAISLGEALLTSAGARDPKAVIPDPGSKGVWRADRPARAILVLIPRVPDRFRLIGR